MSRAVHAMPPCDLEPQIVELVLSGRSLDACDADLAAHVAACPVCAETIALARLLREDQRVLCEDTHVPTAGAVWWRATQRARAEAMRTAGAPITLLQGIAGASAVGLFVALGSAVWHPAVQGASRLDGLRDLAALVDAGLSRLIASTADASFAVPMLLAVAACLIVAPIAIYLATADESQN